MPLSTGMPKGWGHDLPRGKYLYECKNGHSKAVSVKKDFHCGHCGEPMKFKR